MQSVGRSFACCFSLCMHFFNGSLGACYFCFCSKNSCCFLIMWREELYQHSSTRSKLTSYYLIECVEQQFARFTSRDSRNSCAAAATSERELRSVSEHCENMNMQIRVCVSVERSKNCEREKMDLCKSNQNALWMNECTLHKHTQHMTQYNGASSTLHTYFMSRTSITFANRYAASGYISRELSALANSRPPVLFKWIVCLDSWFGMRAANMQNAQIYWTHRT